MNAKISALSEFLQEMIEEKRRVEMQEKICSKCGKKKSTSLFYKQAKTKDGYHPYCKKCFGLYNAKASGKQDKVSIVKAQETPPPIKMKVCPSCGQEKELTREYWHSNKSNKNKLDGLCKSCRNIKKRQANAVGESIVLVDFTEHSELLESLQAESKEQLRTIGNQVLWHVLSGVKKEA